MSHRISAEAEALTVNVLGVPTSIILRGEDTAGALAVIRIDVPEGLGVPLHVHTRESETFYVLKGRVKFDTPTGPVVAQPGMTVHMPAGQRHSFLAVDGPASMLVFFAPASMEAMFLELGELAEGPPDTDIVGGICGRYGIAFLPPDAA